MMAVHYHSLIVFLLYGHLARAPFEPLQLTSEQEGGVYLLEQWATPDSLNSWTSSTLDKYRQGSWKVAESAVNAGLKGNLGLVMVAPTAHYALGRTLRAPASAHVKPLVLQYEVKQTTAVECGGAYVKLLPSTDLTTLSSTTDYVVMFGPDRCGPRDRVHFIIRRFDDQSRTWTEHQLTKPPKSKDSDLSVLYTLIIRPDSSFSISIDLDEVRTGSLLADGDFEPPLTQGATMDDPTDIKPDDWDDRETIEDGEEKRPEDWGEEAEAEFIPDPTAKQPAGWLADEPPTVPHPDFDFVPADWDEREDGPYHPPEIRISPPY